VRGVAGDSNLAAWQAKRAAASFRSGQPIHQRAVPPIDGRSRHRLFNEPIVWDDAAMESFFSSLKTEQTRKVYRTRDEAKADDYIERFYTPNEGTRRSDI
jgi:hypothetical protein